MSRAFGGGNPKLRVPANFTTPFSRSINQGGTQFTEIDPSVRALQEESLTGLRGVLGRFQELPSAVINPFRRNLERRRAQSRRSFERRGLGGSSLVSDLLQQQAREDETEAGELLGRTLFEVGKAEQDVFTTIEGIGSTRFTQELESLGFGRKVAELILEKQQKEFENRFNNREALLGFLGRASSALNPVPQPPTGTP